MRRESHSATASVIRRPHATSVTSNRVVGTAGAATEAEAETEAAEPASCSSSAGKDGMDGGAESSSLLAWLAEGGGGATSAMADWARVRGSLRLEDTVSGSSVKRLAMGARKADEKMDDTMDCDSGWLAVAAAATEAETEDDDEGAAAELRRASRSDDDEADALALDGSTTSCTGMGGLTLTLCSALH